jgi:hypothetical protein
MPNEEDCGVTPCSALEIFQNTQVSGSNDLFLYMSEFQFFQNILKIASIFVFGAAVGSAWFIAHGDDLECLVL